MQLKAQDLQTCEARKKAIAIATGSLEGMATEGAIGTPPAAETGAAECRRINAASLLMSCLNSGRRK
jgi:hypothetical protein